MARWSLSDYNIKPVILKSSIVDRVLCLTAPPYIAPFLKSKLFLNVLVEHLWSRTCDHLRTTSDSRVAILYGVTFVQGR